MSNESLLTHSSSGFPSMMATSFSAVAAPLASAPSTVSAAAASQAQAQAQAAAAQAAEKDKELERLRSDVQNLTENLESMIAKRTADKEKLAELERLRLQLLQVRALSWDVGMFAMPY